MILQYEGTKYQGWQKQESTDNTIQGKLENILSKMSGAPVEVHGAGRTDAGVHAKGQVAHFKVDIDMSEKQIWQYLNRYLPEDIAVVSLKEAGDRFHARLNAVGKVYQYRIINSDIPHVFDRRYAYTVEKKLDLEKMRKAADILEGTHDFKAFTSTKKGKKSTVRTIESITIEKNNDVITLTYKGDGFLNIIGNIDRSRTFGEKCWLSWRGTGIDGEKECRNSCTGKRINPNRSIIPLKIKVCYNI